MASHGKYFRLRAGKVEEELSFPAILDENVLTLYIDEDIHIVGTNVSLYSRSSDGQITDYSYLFGNRAVVIDDIRRDGEILYVATKGYGLLVAHLNDRGLLEADTFLTRKSGLPSDFVTSVCPDKNGQIWICTLSGICRMNRISDTDYYIRTYNRNQGFPDAFWEDCRLRLDTQSGHLFIGFSQGVLRINPDLQLNQAFRPRIHLEAIFLNKGNKEGQKPEDPILVYPMETEYSFPFRQNNLIIKLTAVQLSDAKNLEFWYRLHGKDSDWRTAPADGMLNLNNLNPGNYRLVVAAFDRSRKVFSEEKVFLFRIERPFWMSGWFYFLHICLFLGLVYLYFRWRIRHAFEKRESALKLNRQLAESRYLAFQARMNPHFIFNSLNAIQYFITNGDKKLSLTYLSKFARLLRQVLDNTKAVKVTLREEIDILNSYLEMESMRFDGHFMYDFEIEPLLDLEQTEIPGMLIQPFVENAIVHGLLHLESGQGKLRIAINADNRFVYCMVEDNGVGRARAAEINAGRKPNHKSYGMDIARNRLKLLVEGMEEEDFIRIEDREGAGGTRVHLKIPIL